MRRSWRSSEFVDELAADGPVDAVVEMLEIRRREIALEVARIEVVGEVEDLYADGRSVMEEAQALGDLRVQRHERRIPARLVASADEIPILVDDGVGETGADVQDGKKGESL